MERTPGTKKAIEKLLGAVLDPEERDRYPSGTIFLPDDAPWTRTVAIHAYTRGRSLLLVSASGDAEFVGSFAGPTVASDPYAQLHGYFSATGNAAPAEHVVTPIS
jgi:hypothetical protein